MLMIYGPTGYTGRLVLAEALAQGLKPWLGGRSGNVERLAGELGLNARRAGLDEASAGLLDGVRVLLNCAGPFSLSAKPLMQACLTRGVTYLDLAGEAAEHLAALALDRDAKAAGVALIPGVGFGVAPTDCAAALAALALPGAESLIVAYETRGTPSRGTLETVMPLLHTTGWRRRAGRLVPEHPGRETQTFRDGSRSVKVVTNPWRADLVGAGVSTGVPDIDTLATFPLAARALMRLGGSGLGRWIVKQALASAPEGPGAAARAAGGVTIWAEARRGGERRLVTIRGPDAYDFTARCAVRCAILALETPTAAGFQTPTTAFGPDFIRSVAGVEIL